RVVAVEGEDREARRAAVAEAVLERERVELVRARGQHRLDVGRGVAAGGQIELVRALAELSGAGERGLAHRLDRGPLLERAQEVVEGHALRTQPRARAMRLVGVGALEVR